MLYFSSNTMPGENDVVCGGSRMYHFHIGNKRFRQIIERNLQVYVNESKAGKTALISTIVDSLRQASTTGGFVQKDPLNGTFVSVSDHHAREKTSQAFRDALYSHYRSSNFSKKQRRMKGREGPKKHHTLEEPVNLSDIPTSSSHVNQYIRNINPQSHLTQRLGENYMFQRTILDNGLHRPQAHEKNPFNKLDNPNAIIQSPHLLNLVSSTKTEFYKSNIRTEITQSSQACSTSPSEVSLSSKHWHNEENLISIRSDDDVIDDELPTAHELCSFLILDESKISDEVKIACL